MISWAYTWYRPGGRLTLEQTAAHMADLALRMAGVRGRHSSLSRSF